MGFFDFLTEEIAIDLGTANTLIIHNDKVVVDSPSIVAIDRSSNIWLTWKNEWLEKSDYYRFITLIITNISHPEERWIEFVSNLIDD